MATTPTVFNDQKSLTDWVNAWPGKERDNVSLVLIHRATMRTAVRIHQQGKMARELLAPLRIGAFRCHILSRVRIREPSERLSLAYENASSAAYSAYNTAGFPHIENDVAGLLARGAVYAATSVRPEGENMFCIEYATFEGRDSVWEMLRTDARMLSMGKPVKELLELPLWEGRPPQWWQKEHDSFSNTLRSRAENSEAWDIWVDWYNNVAFGKPAFGLSKPVAESLERRIANGNNKADFWLREPKAINSEIAGWARSFGKNQSRFEDFSSRPASIETFVQDNTVHIKNKTPIIDINSHTISSALEDLVGALYDLQQLSNAKNANQSFSRFCGDAAASLQKIQKNQVELFHSGRNQMLMSAYLSTVDEEWDDFSAAKYRSILDQFKQVMSRFPAWNAFVAKSLDVPPRPDVKGIFAELKVLASNFRDTPELIANDLSARFDSFIENFSKRADGWANENAEVERDVDLLVADAAESVSNILRSIAQIAARSLGQRFLKGIKQEAPEQAELAGKRLVRWVFVGSPIYLLVHYNPTVFHWLETILKYLKLPPLP